MAKKKKIKRTYKAETPGMPIRWYAWGTLALAILALYYVFLFPNFKSRSEKFYYYLPGRASSHYLADLLNEENVLKSSLTFKLAATLFDVNADEGLYEFKKGWNNLQILFYLKGKPAKEAMTIDIPVIRSRKKLINLLAKEIGVEADSLKAALKDSLYLKELSGLDNEAFYSVFLPGELKVYKTCNSYQLIDFAYSRYEQFWNNWRAEKAEAAGLLPEEVVILSSIVYSESKLKEEMPMIAGLYINRLNNNMRLESDPTVVFAHNRFNIRRVFNKHKQVKSKYNTYRNKGLPPGPISTIPLYVIDSVLNFVPHRFIYFCAKDDMSGCHVFAETFEEHKKNAILYQKKLDSLRIK
ncbi:aminodeoxychorismate lyase-like protein [Sporocytophaga myxococcoides]|uniref:Endolytic murein transglycosylase n=1 Tax=Sporocytophaga myxococcoides TaxID=153721 RepID=A0A098LAP3_9BACT|nr:endolytic transglycosylase MltG [Sporocytophaga myxococcoides]GAL83519.1 aminodeoxychorismate lyase-like protein [Sporocytophaga myxococcoides]